MFKYPGTLSTGELIELLKEAIRLADDALGLSSNLGTTGTERRVRVISIGMLRHVQQTAKGLALLASNGLTQTAAQLLRPMWETRVNLLYIRKFPESARLFGDYIHVLLKQELDELQKYEETRHHRIASDPSRADEIRGACSSVANKFPKDRYWSGKTPREMAKAVEREWEYAEYFRSFSGLLHCSINALEPYFGLSGTKDEPVGFHTTAEDWAPWCLFPAAKFLIETLREHCAIFGLNAELMDLVERLER